MSTISKILFVALGGLLLGAGAFAVWQWLADLEPQQVHRRVDHWSRPGRCQS